MVANEKIDIFDREVDIDIGNDIVADVSSDTQHGDSGCWYIRGSINGSEIFALVDSGSCTNLLAEEVYDAIDEDHKSELQSTNVDLKGANGQDIRVRGQAFVYLSLDSREFRIPVVVASLHDQLQMILGIRFLKANRAKLDMENGTLSIGGDEIDVFYHGQLNSAFLVTERTLTLPASSAMNVCGFVKGCNMQGLDKNVLIETLPDVNETGVLTPRCLVNVSEDLHVNFPLSNLSKEEKVVLPFTPVAQVQGGCEEIIEASPPQPEIDKQNDKQSQSFCNAVPIAEEIKVPEHLQKLYDETCTRLSPQEAQDFKALLCKYQDVFYHPDMEFGNAKFPPYHLEIPPGTPIINQRVRHYGPFVKKQLEKEVQRLLKQKIIEKAPLSDRWNNNIVLVRKASGGYRLTLDSRQLNQLHQFQPYPLPKCQDVLNSLAGTAVYSKIDLASGFSQLGLHPESRKYTSFQVAGVGKFRFAVLTQGLRNSPSVFTSFLENLLGSLHTEILALYMDDLLIYAKDHSQMFERIQMVFDKFQSVNLKIKAEKSEFFAEKVEFLGHSVHQGGYEIAESRISAINNWKVPSSLKELRSFLGFASYFRRFVRNFSGICECLFDLTKKDTPFIWTPQHQWAFDKLKDMLCTAPVLDFPSQNPDDKMVLLVDASSTQHGCVLVQRMSGKSERVLFYGSKRFTESQTRYCTTLQEFFAVSYWCEKLKFYLFGRHFEIHSDHRPLQYFNTCKQHDGWTARQLMKMQKFDYKIIYVPGRGHILADAMSRMEQSEQKHRPLRRLCKWRECSECVELVPEEELHASCPEKGQADPEKDRGKTTLGTGQAESVKSAVKTQQEMNLPKPETKTVEHKNTPVCVVTDPVSDKEDDTFDLEIENITPKADMSGSYPEKCEEKVEGLLGETCVKHHCTFNGFAAAACDGQGIESKFNDFMQKHPQAEIKKLQREDADLKRVITYLEQGHNNPPPLDEQISDTSVVKALFAQLAVLKVDADGILVREWPMFEGGPVMNQIVAPLKLKREILEWLHSKSSNLFSPHLYGQKSM